MTIRRAFRRRFLDRSSRALRLAGELALATVLGLGLLACSGDSEPGEEKTPEDASPDQTPMLEGGPDVPDVMSYDGAMPNPDGAPPCCDGAMPMTDGAPSYDGGMPNYDGAMPTPDGMPDVLDATLFDGAMPEDASQD